MARLQVAREMAEMDAQRERDASRLVEFGATTRERALELLRLHGTLEAATDAVFVVLEEAGDIAALVALARGGTECQKQNAAGLLWRLAAKNADSRAAIAKEGGIALLVALVLVGTDGQKLAAAAALASITHNADNTVAIVKTGGIAPLVALARGGTDGQKEEAAKALHWLAFNAESSSIGQAFATWWHNADSKVAIAKAVGIAPLVTLARDGTQGQKMHAARALGSLTVNNDNKVAIARAGGIAPLVALARGGTDGQKEHAAAALGNLVNPLIANDGFHVTISLSGIAVNPDNNQAAIAEAGGIAPLVALARDGTDGQKEKAATALWMLAWNNKKNLAAMKDLGYTT